MGRERSSTPRRSALAAAIVVVIVLNATFAFAQEYRADRSAQRLRALLPISARVRRDSQLRVIDATQLVRDDLVVLRPGDRISADLNLTVSHALAVDPWSPAKVLPFSTRPERPYWPAHSSYKERARGSSRPSVPIRRSHALLH